MFSATYFTYDGTHSSVFGLQMLDFNDESVTETTAFSPVLKLNKTKASKRFFFGGISYDDAPQHTFSVISASAIDDTTRREILTWLTGRNGFKKLVIHQDDLETYWYNCIFTNVDIIYVQGLCHGFRLTATFDSPYQYGQPKESSVSGNCVKQMITLHNASDIADGYIYPTIEITGNIGSELIISSSRDPGRDFKLTGLIGGDNITINNELRQIISEGKNKYLNGFNKNWLRLKKGTHYLYITCNCDNLKIIRPTYVMIGF